jgi:AraC-like DNA-binding protein
MTTPITNARFDDAGVVASLLREALGLLDADPRRARQRIADAISLASTPSEPLRRCCGKLAGWQFKRADLLIRGNLSSKLRIDDVASALNLSSSYFSRAFKATTGMTYSEFVSSARLTRAKTLLLTTRMSIVEVALACGLADQSHLTRVFSRSVGLPPYAWRRLHQRTDGVEADSGLPDRPDPGPRRGTVLDPPMRSMEDPVDLGLFATRALIVRT